MDQEKIKRGKGLVFIISAPSGTGKTTLIQKVMEGLGGLRFSISYTTRAPRANERDGVDYHFVTPGVFHQMVQKDQFLEWAEVLGHYYGTPIVDEKALESEGVDLILDIDTQGAKKAKERLKRAILVFLLPPSFEILRERLIGRGLDSMETIQFRLFHAKHDIEEAHGYHYIIINKNVEESAERLKSIILSERCKREEHHGKSNCRGLPQEGGESI